MDQSSPVTSPFNGRHLLHAIRRSLRSSLHGNALSWNPQFCEGDTVFAIGPQNAAWTPDAPGGGSTRCPEWTLPPCLIRRESGWRAAEMRKAPMERR